MTTKNAQRPYSKTKNHRQQTRLYALLLLLPLATYSCGEQESSGICSASSVTLNQFSFDEIYTTDDGTTTIRIASAIPNPVNRGDNTWQLELLSPDGSSITDAEILLEPTMPGHGHGTFPATFTGIYNADKGYYDLGPFELMMPGHWLFSFFVTLADGTTDRTTISFCLES
ncbi:MAG: hypothetical protein HOK28_14430 [Deltaproteobacteria bacterium]|nr:hypothetical protein [Deltaproteobacteria bacterium]